MLGLAIIGTAGLAVILYSTSLGAGLSDDSYYYIAPARSLIAGQGFNPFPHFPPLLPILLSLIGLAGVDPLVSIRWLNTVLFAANSILAGWLVYRLTGSSMGSLLASLLFVIASHLIETHAWAMSEPLYILLMFLGFICFFKYTPDQGDRKPSDTRFTLTGPILTGLCFGLAALTRYIGFSLLLAGGIVWLFFSSPHWKARLQNALVFSVTGLLPNLAWLGRNIFTFSRTTDRSWSWHPAPLDWWKEALNSIIIWFIPGRFVHGFERFWLVGGSVLLLGGILWAARQHRTKIINSSLITIQTKTLILIGVSILSYFCIMIFAKTFLDPRIPSDFRLLAPVWSMVIALVVIQAVNLWKNRFWFAKLAAVLIILVPLTTNTVRSIETIQSYHVQGRGYASARNHVSETYDYLRRYPNTPMFSNAWVGIYFWTGRETYSIPGPENIQAMKTELHESGGFLVIFDSIPLELYHQTREALTDGLVEVIRLSEATIYQHP